MRAIVSSKPVVCAPRHVDLVTYTADVIKPNDARPSPIVCGGTIGLCARETELFANYVSSIHIKRVVTDTSPSTVVEDLNSPLSVRAPCACESDCVLVCKMCTWTKFALQISCGTWCNVVVGSLGSASTIISIYWRPDKCVFDNVQNGKW